jgi:hypothetical protein
MIFFHARKAEPGNIPATKVYFSFDFPLEWWKALFETTKTAITP